MKTAKEILFAKFKQENGNVTLEIEIMADKICEAMEEYRLTFDESARANYYEDKIDMLNRHLIQRDKEILSIQREQSLADIRNLASITEDEEIDIANICETFTATNVIEALKYNTNYSIHLHKALKLFEYLLFKKIAI